MLTHEALLEAVPHTLDSVDIPGLGEKIQGKVRDMYRRDGQRILISTDRVSAFDRLVGLIPYKGQVLNQLSAWWFEETADLVPNHLITVPDPNVMVVHETEPLPVEIVVRGYITGVTKTSLWYLYEQGERRPYGIPLPGGLKKNDPLPAPIITPTSKAAAGGHDVRLTREEILKQGLVSPEIWEQVETIALALFARGQEVARRGGMILVDTKYEMGLMDGRLVLIDELHTPDSSRYWMAETLLSGKEREHFDKEFLRQWFAGQNYRGEGAPPPIPDDIAAQVAARYIAAYERLTHHSFIPGRRPVAERIIAQLRREEHE